MKDCMNCTYMTEGEDNVWYCLSVGRPCVEIGYGECAMGHEFDLDGEPCAESNI